MNFWSRCQHVADIVDNSFGPLQRRARGHENAQLAEIVVARWLERNRNAPERDNRCNKRKPAQPHCPKPVVNAVRPEMRQATLALQCSNPAAVHRPGEHFHVDVHEAPLAMRRVAMRFQEIGRHHRRDEARDGQTDEHSRYDRQAEILEKLARYAGHQAHRQEHSNNRHRRREYGKTDFIGSID